MGNSRQVKLYIWFPQHYFSSGHVGISIPDYRDNGSSCEQYFSLRSDPCSHQTDFDVMRESLIGHGVAPILVENYDDDKKFQHDRNAIFIGLPPSLNINAMLNKIVEIKAGINRQEPTNRIYYGTQDGNHTCASAVNAILNAGEIEKLYPFSNDMYHWKRMIILYLKPSFSIALGTPLYYHLFKENGCANDKSMIFAMVICMLNFLFHTGLELLCYRWFVSEPIDRIKVLPLYQQSHLVSERDGIDILTSFFIHTIVGVTNVIITRYENKRNNAMDDARWVSIFVDTVLRMGSIAISAILLGNLLNQLFRKNFFNRCLHPSIPCFCLLPLLPAHFYYQALYLKRIEQFSMQDEAIKRRLADKELFLSFILIAFLVGLVLSNNIEDVIFLHSGGHRYIYGLYFFVGAVLSKVSIRLFDSIYSRNSLLENDYTPKPFVFAMTSCFSTLLTANILYDLLASHFHPEFAMIFASLGGVLGYLFSSVVVAVLGKTRELCRESCKSYERLNSRGVSLYRLGREDSVDIEQKNLEPSYPYHC